MPEPVTKPAVIGGKRRPEFGQAALIGIEGLAGGE
jgi:hypothetical protein